GGEAVDLGQVGALLRGSARELEHHEVSRDAAAVVVPVGGRGGDVVGHQEDGDVRALGAQAAGGRTEVEHVAGVVAERDEDACARVGGAAHVEHLAGRRGREDVAADGGVGQAVADQAGEGRVVPGPAADDD